MRKCLQVDTLVRTSEGAKKIADVRVGDYLYDEYDNPVLCTAAGDVRTGSLKKVTYTEFDAATKTSLVCTPDHLLSLRAAGCGPYISSSGTRVSWYTRCDRSCLDLEAAGLSLEERIYLAIGGLVEDLVKDQITSIDSNPSNDDVRKYVDSVVDAHFHMGHVEYSNKIDAALRSLKMVELENNPDALKDALYDAVTAHIEYLVSHDLDDNDVEGDDTELWDLDDVQNSQSSDSTYVPGRSAPPTDDGQPSAPQSQNSLADSVTTSDLSINSASLAMFSRFSRSVDNGCSCGGLRFMDKKMKNGDQAELVYKILSGDHHHLIDPFIVRDGDTFELTVQQFENLCTERVREKKILKLYRSPHGLASSDPVVHTELPVDPYFLGFWLGDGCKSTADVASSDQEIKIYMHNYVDRLNAKRPDGARLLKLKESVMNEAGSAIGDSGYSRSVAVYRYSITSPNGEPGYRWNPVLSGLKELGLLGDKSGGIPDVYKNADEDSRLAVLAGLMESDGCLRPTEQRYALVQHTDEHAKIVYDTKEVAQSCGIVVNSVLTRTGQEFGTGKMGTETRYEVFLGKGSEKFQHHLLMARKKMNNTKKWMDHDIRSIVGIEDDEAGKYRAIQVSGGHFQLENRLVVHNCHLNT